MRKGSGDDQTDHACCSDSPRDCSRPIAIIRIADDDRNDDAFSHLCTGLLLVQTFLFCKFS